MKKEEELLRKRFIELSNIAFHQDRSIFSSFLNLNELNILHTTPVKSLYSSYKTFGGYDAAERQMTMFFTDVSCCELKYPISILEAQVLSSKYAEELSHRDYLGAILNLGIERAKIGDILVMEKNAVFFAEESLCEFIINHLSKIKHTAIQVQRKKDFNKDYTIPYEEIKGTVASIRLDSLISLAFTASRSKLTALIESGKVFVNGKLITTNSYLIKEEDFISVRGLGKFQYKGILSNTKKGRLFVLLFKYK